MQIDNAGFTTCVLSRFLILRIFVLLDTLKATASGRRVRESGLLIWAIASLGAEMVGEPFV